MDRAASGDHRRFWKRLRNRNKKDTVKIQSLQVGNQTFKDDNVVEGFAEHYRGVFDFHYTEPCTEFVQTKPQYVYVYVSNRIWFKYILFLQLYTQC